jgi:hypothetical protein
VGGRLIGALHCHCLVPSRVLRGSASRCRASARLGALDRYRYRSFLCVYIMCLSFFIYVSGRRLSGISTSVASPSRFRRLAQVLQACTSIQEDTKRRLGEWRASAAGRRPRCGAIQEDTKRRLGEWRASAAGRRPRRGVVVLRCYTASDPRTPHASAHRDHPRGEEAESNHTHRANNAVRQLQACMPSVRLLAAAATAARMHSTNMARRPPAPSRTLNGVWSIGRSYTL